MNRKRIVIGNWKMHGTMPEALKLITGLEHHIKTAPDIDVVLCPPFTAIYTVGAAMGDITFGLGAQDCHWEDRGAFTGEISPAFLADLECRYVILGHSERRQFNGETDERINKKLDAALRAELTPILCIGESLDERESGKTWDVLERQLRDCLRGLHMREMEHCVVAYEPVWAIGTDKPATPELAAEAHHFIRNTIAKRFDAPTAGQVRIVYGGSVKSKNIAGFAKIDDIDGALVGGASLDAEEFADIIRAMERPIGGRA